DSQTIRNMDAALQNERASLDAYKHDNRPRGGKPWSDEQRKEITRRESKIDRGAAALKAKEAEHANEPQVMTAEAVLGKLGKRLAHGGTVEDAPPVEVNFLKGETKTGAVARYDSEIDNRRAIRKEVAVAPLTDMDVL